MTEHYGHASAMNSAERMDAGHDVLDPPPPELSPMPHSRILGTRVHASSYREATDLLCRWAERAESRYVCICTVHMVMEGYDDPAFQAIVNAADLVTSDGMPMVWGLRALGIPGAQRVYGPDLMLWLCERAARDGIPVGFYGGTPEVLERLVETLVGRYRRLKVGYCFSPPFRPLSDAERAAVVQDVGESGVRLLFVGLGCPKQERWMAEHRGEFAAVLVGVGAGFDFAAGAKRQAPRWMQRHGLEWFFRLLSEPKRLWRRYLYHNPRFVVYFAAQLIRWRWMRLGNSPPRSRNNR